MPAALPAEDEERSKSRAAPPSCSSAAMVYATLPIRQLPPSAEQPQQGQWQIFRPSLSFDLDFCAVVFFPFFLVS